MVYVSPLLARDAIMADGRSYASPGCSPSGVPRSHCRDVPRRNRVVVWRQVKLRDVS